MANDHHLKIELFRRSCAQAARIFGRAFSIILFGMASSASVPAWAADVSAGSDRRPNVIILMPDQMRGQALGVAGNEQVRTPNLDHLARQGLYLPNTIANDPVCCPARATILTGTYPPTHGVLVNDLRLREATASLAELLAEAGYVTGFVGKWHLDGGRRDPGFVPPGPRRQGFKFWAANECNHNHFNSAYFRDTPQAIPIKKFEPQVWMDEALRFIRENKERPFFLWWTCGPPHDPYGAPPEYEQLYDPARLKLPPNYQSGAWNAAPANIAKYYAAISAIDEQVGRLMKELDQLGLAEDTLVIFVSDHGDMLGSHGLPLKCHPYEESIRVPGIIRYPRRIKAAQRRDWLFSHVDIAPTVLAFCGRPIPGNMQGRDLAGLLDGRGGVEPEAVLLQNFEPRPQHGIPAAWRGLRTKRYMYARFRDRAWCLFDLEKDPWQLDNLADKPEHAALQARLEALLQREMTRTGDKWELDFASCQILYNGPAVYHPDELKAR